jgi:hypothetical protein
MANIPAVAAPTSAAKCACRELCSIFGIKAHTFSTILR